MFIFYDTNIKKAIKNVIFWNFLKFQLYVYMKAGKNMEKDLDIKLYNEYLEKKKLLKDYTTS